MRIGILGTGNIAGWWLERVQPSSRVQVVAVGSRDAARASAFASRYGLSRWHGSYAALVADNSIDAVYVALPDHLHARWCIAAARAGRHVLCEKPLAPTGAEAHAMFAAARDAGVVLLEAFAYSFTAETRLVRDLLRASAIGRPQLVRANTSYVRSGPAGGGALRDSGCYCVSMARIVFGQRPRRVHAAASYDNSGLDEILVGTLDFGEGYAQFSCSFLLPEGPQTQIIGTDGVIEVELRNAAEASRRVTVRLKRGKAWDAEFERIDVPGTDGYRAEAEALADLAEGRLVDGPGMSESESIDVAATLEALAEAARRESWTPVSQTN